MGEEYKMEENKVEENKIEDKTEKTFKELYLAGEIGFDEIDRYISHWNNSDDERTLAVYLGLNADEEDVWIDESDEALQEMLDKQKARGEDFCFKSCFAASKSPRCSSGLGAVSKTREYPLEDVSFTTGSGSGKHSPG